MENRLEELRDEHPRTSESIDSLINMIASFSRISDDEITSKEIDKLHTLLQKDFEEGL